MSKFKFLPILASAVTIGIAGFLTSPAIADTITSDLTVASTPNGLVTGNFGTVTIMTVADTSATCNAGPSSCAQVTFNIGTDDTAFIDSHIANLNTTSFVTSVDTTNGIPSGLSSTGSNNVDGFGVFNITTAANGICTGSSLCPSVEYFIDGSFTSAAQILTLNGNGFDASAHILAPGILGCGSDTNTCFAGEVPAPVIGHGLLVLLAVGGVLFGGKFLENLKKRQLHAA